MMLVTEYGHYILSIFKQLALAIAIMRYPKWEGGIAFSDSVTQ
jgi:hypothetical protein